MTHPALAQTAHRAWPLPSGPWAWRQAWNDLLFVHYPVPPADLAPLLPPGLTLQTFAGTSWVGVVAFKMEHVMRRPFPDLPGFSNFLELNVRLYVEYRGKPGVFFLSLDATNRLAVWGGRYFYSVPYRNADIILTHRKNSCEFVSRRKEPGDRAEFAVRYETKAVIFQASPGTLEHFLTERYCLFAVNRRGLSCTEVHHLPWPLQIAQGEISKNTLLENFGVSLSHHSPPLLHYSRGVEVVSWPPTPLD